MSDTPGDLPSSADQLTRLQRRSFVRAVSRDALHAAAVLVGASDAVRSIALRAVMAARPMVSADLAPVPVVVTPKRAGELPTGLSAYRRDAAGQLLVTDRTLLPGSIQEVACVDGSGLARLLGRHAVGSGPVLGELAAYALAGTAAAVASMDRTGQANVLRATSAIIGATRPESGALADALRRSAALWAADDDAAVREGLSALGDSLSVDLAAAIDAMAGHAMSLAAPVLATGGDLLLHGGFARLATGTRSGATAVMRQARALGLEPGVWITDGGPSREGRISTARDLAADGVRGTVVADAVVGSLLASGRIGTVLAFAERITNDGTVIGPVGTYVLAVLAALHRVPFLVLAPMGVIDGPDRAPAGRSSDRGGRLPTGRPGALVDQTADVPPLMDETPPELVTAVVTETGPR